MTILEKTNNDLISRAGAIDYLMINMGWHDEDGYEVDDADEKRAIITDLLNGVPAVDAVPVAHGRWLTHDWVYGVAYCSNCAYELKSNNTKFCPNCGAKMDGERRADDGKVDR